MAKVCVLIFIAFTFARAFAQEPKPVALTFQAWKEQQILEAQNQSLRISARISQLKGAKASTPEKDSHAPVTNSKIKKSEADSVVAAERDLRRAQDSLQTANALTLEDYVTVYLPTLQEQPDALDALALKLTKEELAELFKSMVRKEATPSSDAKRNGRLSTSSLTGSVAPRNL